MLRRSVPLLAFLLIGLLLPDLASAQQPVPADSPAVQEPPPAFQVTTRLRTLTSEAAEAERRIATLSSPVVLEQELEEAERRQEEIQSRVSRIAELEYVRSERITHLRTQTLENVQQLDALRQQTVERLEELQQLRTQWVERRTFWENWRSAVADTPEFGFLEAEFQRAQRRIEEVLGRIQEAIPMILSQQNELDELQLSAQALVEELAALQTVGREARVQRSEPVLFTPAFFERIADVRWRPITALRQAPYSTFFAQNATTLFLHLALALVLGVMARRLRRLTIPEGAWSGFLLRPWSSALLLSTAVAYLQYSLPPPIWDVVIWSLIAFCGVRLAHRFFQEPAARFMVDFVAFFYPAFLLAEAIQLPVPFFRLGLAATAAAAVFLSAGLFVRERSRGAPPLLQGSLCLFMLVWFGVLLAEVLGFYLLARWLMHTAVTSIFVLLVAGFLFEIVRGAMRTLLRLEAAERFRVMRSIGLPVTERLLKLFQVVLVVVATLTILNIWEITPPPGEAWAALTELGFTVAGINITLGRILLAAFLIYMAILSSWLLRTFMRSELYPRWELERGIGNSINSLLNYVLLTLGVLLALGAMGVELQNFAIVAGALGVGIGFGLQNIVNNFVSGLILLFERPVRVGDTVMIDEEFGEIQKIGLRSTTVVTYDQSEVIVPNAHLVSEKVTNWTLTDPVARLIVPVGVAYGSDVALVMDLLDRCKEAHPSVMDDPEPIVLFRGFGDSALNFELRVWVSEIRMRFRVKSALLAEIERSFKEAGVTIPFPQRDLHVRSIQEKILDASRLRKPKDSAEASGPTSSPRSSPSEE